MHKSNRFSWFPSWESSFWYYAIIIGLAILSMLIKQTCIFFIWCIVWYLFSPRRAVLVMIGLCCVFLLSFTPFLPEGFEGIYHNVLTYSGGWGTYYGFSRFIPRPLATLIALITLILLPLWLKKSNAQLIDALRIVGVTTIVVLPGFGMQYATLLLAPAVFKINRWFALTSAWYIMLLVGTMTIVIWKRTTIATGIEIIGYTGLWFSSVAWLVSELMDLNTTNKGTA